MNNNWRSGGGRILSHVLKVTELEFDPCWNFRDKAQDFQTYSKRACPANDNWENHLDKCVALYCAGCYSLWPSPLPPNSCLPFSAVPHAKGLTPLGFPYPLATAWTQSTKGPIKRPEDGKRESISPPHPAISLLSYNECNNNWVLFYYSFLHQSSSHRLQQAPHPLLTLKAMGSTDLPCCLFFGWFNFPSFFPWTLHTLW